MAAAVAALAAWTSLAADAPSWRVVRGEVRVVCPLTIGGAFEAKTASLAGTLVLANPRPPSWSGDLTLDLRTLDTGINLRNEHLRNEYLEVERGSTFATAVLSEIHLGDVDAQRFQGRTSFGGTLSLHGTKKAIAGQAEVRREGESVRVEASFPVTLADYAIKKPQYLGVGVKGEVQVKVLLVAAAQ